jgi:hypothetical protein
MTLRASLSASACRAAVRHGYHEGRVHAAGQASDMPPHWWGLCDAWSRHCLAHGELLPETSLWSELTPFLLLDDENEAVSLLAEYAVFVTAPAEADIERLGVRLNPALHRVDMLNDHVVSFLHDAMEVRKPRWLALLSYETLQSIRRTLRVAAETRRDMGRPWHGKGGPLWLRRGPGEVESETVGSLEG